MAKKQEEAKSAKSETTTKPKLPSKDIIRAYKAKESMGTIAKSHGISTATVRSVLIEGGVEIRPRGRTAAK